MQRDDKLNWVAGHLHLIVPAALYAGAFVLFASTLATQILFGDPGEYTFVPHMMGVIHPPGYAFYTLLAKAWQAVVPVGSVAYRTHLLSAAAGALLVMLVYGCVRQLTPRGWRGLHAYLPGISAAVSLALSHDIWQHASHANAHIITVTLAALGTFLLLRWRRVQQESDRAMRYLYAFAFVAGVAPTHHALLAFSFPAWGLFILAVRPKLLREPRRLARLVVVFAAGMFAWLYFPLRSAAGVPFGPEGMHTLDGFLDLVLARGLRVNLFHFGAAQQGQRALVFITLLALQFNPVQIALAVLGLGRLVYRAGARKAGLLAGLLFAVNLAFIINTVQDVMAYLMVPFMAAALMLGAGVIAVIAWLDRRPRLARHPAAVMLLALLVLAPPCLGAASLAPRVNLNDYTAAADYVEDVYAQFAGQGEGAVLLADWEHLTPLWYNIHVQNRPLSETDVKLVYVTAGANPWVDNAWAHFGEGLVYVTGYRRALVDAGFRLRPVRPALPGYGGSVPGDLYHVLLPPSSGEADRSSAMPAQAQHDLGRAAGVVEVVGYDLPLEVFEPGDIVPLVLYMRSDAPPESIIFPYVELGQLNYDFTTDSHWLTPWWEPGEIIGERFDLNLPADLAPGEYTLSLGLRDLQAGKDLPFEDGEPVLTLGQITVEAGGLGYESPELLVDIGHRVGLETARVGLPLVGVSAPWQTPVEVRPGDSIDLVLTWRALAPVEESYTVFVHLIDAGNHVVEALDYTPLGGAFPTQLWFPKWLPGQAVWDPYQLKVPDDTPPGDYFIEVGMYGMTSIRRVPQFDAAGNLAGDRYILGPVRVIE
jgi:hypothetical protein